MSEQATGRSRRGLRIAAAAAVLVAVASGFWWWSRGLPGGEDPRLAEIRVMHEKMAATFPPGQPIRTPDEASARVAAMQAVLEKVQALPPELRPRALMSGSRPFRASMDAKIDHFFTLPADQRNAFLDVEIGQMEMMRAAFGAGTVPPGAAAVPPGDGGVSGAAGAASAARRPPFPFPDLSEAEAEAMRKRMIDGTSPARRARMEEFFTAMQNRRRERGLPDLPEPP